MKTSLILHFIYQATAYCESVLYFTEHFLFPHLMNVTMFTKKRYDFSFFSIDDELNLFLIL